MRRAKFDTTRGHTHMSHTSNRKEKDSSNDGDDDDDVSGVFVHACLHVCVMNRTKKF